MKKTPMLTVFLLLIVAVPLMMAIRAPSKAALQSKLSSSG